LFGHCQNTVAQLAGAWQHEGMSNELRRVAHINHHELSDLPPEWGNPERGRFLRRLLRCKGIDPDRYYQVTYHPLPRCWLLTQAADKPRDAGNALANAQEEEQFNFRALAEFRYRARAACAALAANSIHFARFGRPYKLPEKAEVLTPADLANQLGGAIASGEYPLLFDNEGGWRAG
jgi:hypothetical protein